MEKLISLPKWTQRTFQFGYSNDFIPFLVERLAATGARIREMIAEVDKDALSHKPDGRWSVKEHIGHLTDLEILHEGRLDDFRDRLEVLRPADMANRRTEEANHNLNPAESLLRNFRDSRRHFFETLNHLDEGAMGHRAMHPRLKQMVGIADILYFMGEHDNHHLTVMASQLPLRYLDLPVFSSEALL